MTHVGYMLDYVCVISFSLMGEWLDFRNIFFTIREMLPQALEDLGKNHVTFHEFDSEGLFSFTFSICFFFVWSHLSGVWDSKHRSEHQTNMQIHPENIDGHAFYVVLWFFGQRIIFVFCGVFVLSRGIICGFFLKWPWRLDLDSAS